MFKPVFLDVALVLLALNFRSYLVAMVSSSIESDEVMCGRVFFLGSTEGSVFWTKFLHTGF